MGSYVRLKPVNKRHWQDDHYHAHVADIDDDTVKVRYTDGGYKRFTTSDFLKLAEKSAEPNPLEYEVLCLGFSGFCSGHSCAHFSSPDIQLSGAETHRDHRNVM